MYLVWPRIHSLFALSTRISDETVYYCRDQSFLNPAAPARPPALRMHSMHVHRPGVADPGCQLNVSPLSLSKLPSCRVPRILQILPPRPSYTHRLQPSPTGAINLSRPIPILPTGSLPSSRNSDSCNQEHSTQFSSPTPFFHSVLGVLRFMSFSSAY